MLRYPDESRYTERSHKSERKKILIFWAWAACVPTTIELHPLGRRADLSFAQSISKDGSCRSSRTVKLIVSLMYMQTPPCSDSILSLRMMLNPSRATTLSWIWLRSQDSVMQIQPKFAFWITWRNSSILGAKDITFETKKDGTQAVVGPRIGLAGVMVTDVKFAGFRKRWSLVKVATRLRSRGWAMLIKWQRPFSLSLTRRPAPEGLGQEVLLGD